LPGSTNASYSLSLSAISVWPELDEIVDVELVVREQHEVLEVSGAVPV
jgi:hypothetical protein